MRQVGNGVPSLVDLVEDVVSEELDDVAVPSFRPPGIQSESEKK